MKRLLLWLTGVLALLPLARVARPDPPPQGEVRSYFSAIDGSRQSYGLYLPRANPPSDRGYPLVMHAHGYGWWVGADFSAWQRQWADDHGWILVNVNGRGPNFYDGIGEDDVLRVLDDTARLVAVDRSRVYITGGSMGGTGAYRMGVRRPDVFPGAAPVDGWTDFREFHWHWYERKDMPNSIEEFRRPLLEAISPLYVAGTARWGNVQLIVDGRDDVVFPRNGLGLSEALQDEQDAAPDAYRHELVYNPDRGHGGGYDIRRIYEYLLTVSGLQRPPAVTIEATLLRYGKVHWASIDRFQLQGAMGRLDAYAEGSAVYVFTSNLAALTISLPDSPVAGQERVQVVIEGVPCYDGPPAEVSFAMAPPDAEGGSGWRLLEGLQPGLHKRRGLEGPIGEAFLAPFVVLWGTAGDSNAVRQGQIEAEDFANEWNAFNVHYEAVRAKPEDELTADERSGKNLVIFGTLDSSSLLREMAAACDLPVQVFGDCVIVRDPANGDRTYEGAKYGAYWVYPNPLTSFATLVVGCKGRFATKPDGSVPRGLGYDLEKLQWGWGDYVVFDSDIGDLPYVENVNNKPPVITYEAGYFVEAGFLDQDWRPDRAIELNRVRAIRPEGSRLIHLDSVTSVAATDRRPGGVEVRVVDERGGPVAQARVTLTWVGTGQTFSRPGDGKGVAFFPLPEGPATEGLRATVVNVCATAATYSWPDDRERDAVCGPGQVCSMEVEPSPARAETAIGGAVSFGVSVANRGAQPLDVMLLAPDGPGVVSPATHGLSVAPGQTRDARFVWDAGDLPAGDYAVPLTVAAQSSSSDRTTASATPVFTVLPERTLDVDVVGVAAPDRRLGEPFEVLAEIENRDPLRGVTAIASCVIVEARRYLPTQEVRLGPGGKATIWWGPTPGSAPLGTGIYTARVSLPETPGAVGEASFVVK